MRPRLRSFTLVTPDDGPDPSEPDPFVVLFGSEGAAEKVLAEARAKVDADILDWLTSWLPGPTPRQSCEPGSW